MTLERLQIATCVVIGAVIWFSVLLLQGKLVCVAHRRPFSIVESSLVGFGKVFEFVLWPQPWRHGLFVKRPYQANAFTVTAWSYTSFRRRA